MYGKVHKDPVWRSLVDAFLLGMGNLLFVAMPDPNVLNVDQSDLYHALKIHL